MAELLPTLKQLFLDTNGKPLVGGKLYSYKAGTTTPQATYANQAGTIPNPNPIILDGNGEAEVWIGPLTYKFVLTDANGVTRWALDNVVAAATGSALGAAVTAAQNSADAAAAGAGDAADSASAAASSATSASSFASAASTSASNAATSANDAAGFATSASTSASNAATSETNAHNSKSEAATSATNASNSAAAAATSASAASGFADAAAASATLAAGIIPDQSGNAGKVLTTDGAAVSWEDPGAAILSVISKTANYTATPGDGYIGCDASSGSFTVILYTAVGNSGRTLLLQKTDTSLNAVTIDANGSETINGDLTTTLNTVGESVRIVSNGSNWVILDRYARTKIATQTITIGAVTTAPVKGTTAIDRVEWFRDGQYLDAVYRYKQTAIGSATAGSGNYLFSLPAGLSVDTTYIPFSTNSNADHVDNHPAIIGFGAGWDQGGPSSKITAHPVMYNSTQFRILACPISTPQFMGSGAWPLNATTSNTWRFHIRVPIAGWKS